jgi:hypothetical protein
LQKQGEGEQRLVIAYVEGHDEIATCRRVVLHGYLDRREKERMVCEEREEKCDVCRKTDEGESEEGEEEKEKKEEKEGEGDKNEKNTSNDDEMEVVETEREEAQRAFHQQEQARRGPRQTLIQHRQHEFADMEWLRRQLAWWTNRCGICEAAGDKQSGHDVRRCWRAESQEAKANIEEMEEKMRFEAYSDSF